MIDNFANRAADWDNPSKIDMTSKFVEALLQRIEISNSWRAMEIGAGTGLVGLQLMPKLKSIVFEDTSTAMLEVLLRKLANAHAAEILDAEVFAYQKRDIDFVFACMAFHHIPDIEATLKHMHGITTNRAYIVIGDIRTEDGSFHHFEPIPHKGFDTATLSKVLKSTGFETLSCSTYNVLTRERSPGKFTDYEQFILVARKCCEI